MRLEKYITEGRSKTIDQIGALAMAKKCSNSVEQYIKSASVLWRGIQTKEAYEREPFRGDYLTIQPSKFERRLAYSGGNHYTLMMDNLPQWKAFPKRGRGLVCSSDRDYADGYNENGNLFAVFPVNGSKVGVCPKEDIYDSFKLVWSMGGFSKSMESDGFDDKNWKSLVMDMKEFSEDLQNDRTDYFNYDILDLVRGGHQIMEDSGDDFYKFFERVMDPKFNGFKLKKAGDKLIDGYECWTDGDCLMVSWDELGNFIEEYQNL